MTYIIEHPTQGVLVNQNWISWDREWRSQFSVSASRSQAKQFATLADAMTARSRLNARTYMFAEVREAGTWKVVS